MILAIDTSLGSAVAVVDLDGRVRGETIGADRLGHAEAIGLLIEGALAAAGADPTDVSYVAAGMGPGPFTGLRVGIAAARTFALARGVPVVPVVSHDAAAAAAHTARAGATGWVAIATDARRREVALSVYRTAPDAASPLRIGGPVLVARDTDLAAAALALAEGAEPSHVATEPALAQDPSSPRAAEPALAQDPPPCHAAPPAPAIAAIDIVEVTSISAGALGAVAARAIASGWEVATSEPLYLRAPDVTLAARPKRVSV